MLQSESEIAFQVRWKPRTDEMTKKQCVESLWARVDTGEANLKGIEQRA